MAEEYTAASLSKKTVVQLKELLATHSLPVTGKKDDLIQRLLAHLSTLSSEPTTTDTTGAASAVDEPDGQGHSGTAEVSQAANVETEKSAEEVVDGVRTAPGAEEAQGELDAGGVKDKEEEEEAVKKQAREAEEEKRRKRAERFNVGGGGSAGPSEEEVAKLKRAEKFGTGGQKEEQQADGGKLDKSLALLDAPLGSSRRQGQGREPKSQNKPEPTSKSSAPANGGGVTNAAAAKKGGVSAAEAAAEPAAAVAADPELKRKLEEEEEKKRKRLERFGGPPAEKKAKLDDSSSNAPAAETTIA